ncbi:hypothetical protein LCGC14_1386070 [marine sediment metagenome]|uniref:Uncharacterized protein n=1 Tax=marine sediment metagenome TaxID=412755 RepID=A0A0F9K1K0_9ZZZZ
MKEHTQEPGLTASGEFDPQEARERCADACAAIVSEEERKGK